MSEKLNTSEIKSGRIDLKRTVSTLAAAAFAMGALAGCNDEKVNAAPELVETTQSEVVTEEEVVSEGVEEVIPKEEASPAMQESEGVSPEGLPYSIDNNGFVIIPEEYVTIGGLQNQLMTITNPEHVNIVKAYPESQSEKGHLNLSITLPIEVYKEKISEQYYHDANIVWGQEGDISINDIEDWMMTERQYDALKTVHTNGHIEITFEAYPGDSDMDYRYGNVFTPIIEELSKYSVVAPTGATEPLSGINTVSNLIIFKR